MFQLDHVKHNSEKQESSITHEWVCRYGWTNESQVTRYAPLFEDDDKNTSILHIETYGVIQTIESEVMRNWVQYGNHAPQRFNGCLMKDGVLEPSPSIMEPSDM